MKYKKVALLRTFFSDELWDRCLVKNGLDVFLGSNSFFLLVTSIVKLRLNIFMPKDRLNFPQIMRADSDLSGKEMSQCIIPSAVRSFQAGFFVQTDEAVFDRIGSSKLTIIVNPLPA